MKRVNKDSNIICFDEIKSTKYDLDKNLQDKKWKDWRTSTYDYTIDSIEYLDKKTIFKYINKIHENMRNETSPYSKEYLEECLMNIEIILQGGYESIDLLENIGAYYPDREEFVECLKRLSKTK